MLPSYKGTAGEFCLQDYDHQQEEAADDRLPVGRKRDPALAVFEVKHIEEDPEQQHTSQRGTNGTHAPCQQGPAHHNCSDGEKLPTNAFDGLASTELRSEDDTGKPGKTTACEIDQELYPIGRKSHQPRCVLIAADGEYAAAGAGVIEDDPANHIGRDRNPRGNWETRGNCPGQSR